MPNGRRSPNRLLVALGFVVGLASGLLIDLGSDVLRGWLHAPRLEAVYSMRITESRSRVDTTAGGAITFIARDPVRNCSLGRTVLSGSFAALGNPPSLQELLVTVIIYNGGPDQAEGIRVAMQGMNLGFSPTLQASPGVTVRLEPDMVELGGRLRTATIEALPPKNLALLEFRSLLDSLPPGFTATGGDPPAYGPSITVSGKGYGKGYIEGPEAISALEGILTKALMTGGSLIDFEARFSPGVKSVLTLDVLEAEDSVLQWNPPPIPQESYNIPGEGAGGCPMPEAGSLWAVKVGGLSVQR